MCDMETVTKSYRISTKNDAAIRRLKLRIKARSMDEVVTYLLLRDRVCRDFIDEAKHIIKKEPAGVRRA